MITSDKIKEIAINLGADRCGISSVSRFQDAPDGFNPVQIWSECKSVVVFVKRIPQQSIHAENPVVYSHSASTVYQMLDRIGFNLSMALQDTGVNAVPVPTDIPYLFWDEENKKGMGILSLRHAAMNAGLGLLGKNTLLISPELGNMIYIGAVLIDTIIEEDSLTRDFSCLTGCNLCIESCPVNALDGKTVNQKACRAASSYSHPRGWDIYVCNECRKVCPLG